MKAHGMKKVLITNNHINTASMRVCEKLGAKLLRVAELPEWHDLYQQGQRFGNIFECSKILDNGIIFPVFGQFLFCINLVF